MQASGAAQLEGIFAAGTWGRRGKKLVLLQQPFEDRGTLTVTLRAGLQALIVWGRPNGKAI
jgi:hypothetical protein